MRLAQDCPFTTPEEVFGWEMMLLAAGTDADRFGEVARHWEAWIRPFFEACADSTVPVMMVHDDLTWTSGPVIAPEWYRAWIFPAYRRLWRPVLDASKRLTFTSDGDYTVFFDDIVDAGDHCLVMEPCADMAAFAERYGHSHAFVGNADTRILLGGDLAVGNHIPANTPVAAALYYQEVFESLRER